MHGVRRSFIDSAAEEDRYGRWSTETRQLLQQRRALPSERFLECSETILLRNPEEYSLWNRRKECLIEWYLRSKSLETAVSGTPVQESLRERCETEFRVTEGSLRQNPKSYATWAHRLWLLRSTVPSTATEPSPATTQRGCTRPPWTLPSDYAVECLRRELVLCRQLISLDDRNFLGWRHLVEVLRLARNADLRSTAEVATDRTDSVDFDLSFLFRVTQEVLNRNSCNYTAYHYRSVAATEAGNKLDWSRELDALHQAMYTEPNDQSVWFYYHWLIEQLSGSKGSNGEMLESLEAEVQILDSLLELEPRARWALEAKAQLLVYLGRYQEAACICREQLASIDPMRKRMYVELADQYSCQDQEP